MTQAPVVVLAHGWPGLPSDYRLVRQRLESDFRVIVPDLAGFGAGFTGPLPEAEATADAHAARILAQLREEGVERAFFGGYDIGSRIVQAVARSAPERVAGLVVTPAYPGIGVRPTLPQWQAAYWYQHFHRLPLSGALIDGNRESLATYLGHFWRTWSADEAVAADEDFAALVEAYARPGAFTASTAWYRANTSYLVTAPPIAAPTIMLWPGRDPLFPVEWADAVPEWFTDAQVRVLPESGHFVPLEAPDAFAEAVRDVATG